MRKIPLLICVLSSIALLMTPLAPAQSLAEGAPQIRVLFSPRDNCAKEIVSEMDGAQSSIDVAMYLFTSRPIARALVNAKNRGVDVKVCLAGGNEPIYEKFSKSRYLIKNGIDVKSIKGSGIMHNKFCVIDDLTTITGSYNWTTRADLENDENIMIIRSRKTAGIYKDQFTKLWNGTNIDACVYKDKTRLEKVPDAVTRVPTAITRVPAGKRYVASKNSNKFHRLDCKWARRIKPENRVWFGSREEAIKQGYISCKVCKP